MSPCTYSRRRGAFFGTFVGDTLGLPYESSKLLVDVSDLEVQASKRHAAGDYSDDTEMAIAIAEELATVGTIERQALAERFAATFTPGRGYGRKTKQVLGLVRDGANVATATALVYEDAGGSTRNGASMRIAPLAAHFALAPAVERRQQVVESAAASGHLLPLAIDGALAQAEAVGAAVRGCRPAEILTAAEQSVSTIEFVGALAEVRRLLDQTETPTASKVQTVLGNGIEALTSVPAAIWAGITAASFEEAAARAISLGGDTDTIAAMACSIAGARFGYESIPERWLAPLIDDARGRSYVESLCERLWAA